MKISNSEFTNLGAQLILPVFEDTKKAPNNSLNGLNRSQRGLVRDALGSGGLKVRRELECPYGLWLQYHLVWEIEKDHHKMARNAGARLISSLSKKGTDLTVRLPLAGRR